MFPEILNTSSRRSISIKTAEKCQPQAGSREGKGSLGQVQAILKEKIDAIPKPKCKQLRK